MFQVKIFTLYPDFFPGILSKGIYGRAIEKSLWNLDVINIRDYAKDKHKTVDDTPYGGGEGMVLKPDVVAKALDQNLKKNDTDFDKTLEKWGAGEGNYLVLPFIGPRSSRHLAGSIIDIGLNPFNYFLKDEDDIIRISPTMLYAVSARSGNMETIDNLRETSIDYYSCLLYTSPSPRD